MVVTTSTPTSLQHGRETIIYFSLASNLTIATTDCLKDLFGTADDVSAAAKNVTVTPPESAWELVSFLGNDTNSFQNQMIDEKPVGLASLTATLIMDEDELLEDYLDTTSVSISGGYSRYQIGNGQSPEIAVLVSLAKTGTQVNIAYDNARVTKWGDLRITGPDAHWEQDIAITCLADDFYWEYLD